MGLLIYLLGCFLALVGLFLIVNFEVDCFKGKSILYKIKFFFSLWDRSCIFSIILLLVLSWSSVLILAFMLIEIKFKGYN